VVTDTNRDRFLALILMKSAGQLSLQEEVIDAVLKLPQQHQAAIEGDGFIEIDSSYVRHC
jgi:hypothetical protein